MCSDVALPTHSPIKQLDKFMPKATGILRFVIGLDRHKLASSFSHSNLRGKKTLPESSQTLGCVHTALALFFSRLYKGGGVDIKMMISLPFHLKSDFFHVCISAHFKC